MDKEYSKREIDMQLKSVQDHMTDSHNVIDEKLNKILLQTTKTNGRVSVLENWKSYLIGAWAIVSFLVIPMILFFFVSEKENLETKIISNQEEIKNLLDNK